MQILLLQTLAVGNNHQSLTVIHQLFWGRAKILMFSPFLGFLVMLPKIDLLDSARARATLRRSETGLSSGNVSYLESMLQFTVGVFLFGLGWGFVCFFLNKHCQFSNLGKIPQYLTQDGVTGQNSSHITCNSHNAHVWAVTSGSFFIHCRSRHIIVLETSVLE